MNVDKNVKTKYSICKTQERRLDPMPLIIDPTFMNTLTTGQIFISINTGGMAKRTKLENVLESENLYDNVS